MYDWSSEPRYKTLERVEALYGPEGVAEFRDELDRLAKGPPRIGKERAWFAIRANTRYFPPEGPGKVTATAGAVSAPSSQADSLHSISDAIPWKDLPPDADFDSEIRWCYAQFSLVVEALPGRQSVLRWDRAKVPPPSTGTVGLMRWAARNETTFFKEMVPRAFKDSGDGDGEDVRRDNKSIAEMQGMLDRLRQNWQQELIADVPGVIQQTVRDRVDGWVGQYKLSMPDGAKADLVAHVARLVKDCTDAVAHSSGAA